MQPMHRTRVERCRVESSRVEGFGDLEKGKLSGDGLPDTCLSCERHWKLVDIVRGPDAPRSAALLNLMPEEVRVDLNFMLEEVRVGLMRRFVGNIAKLKMLKSEAEALPANWAEDGEYRRCENASAKKKGKSKSHRRRN